jgi:hypothetical protein
MSKIDVLRNSCKKIKVPGLVLLLMHAIFKEKEFRNCRSGDIDGNTKDGGKKHRKNRTAPNFF